MPLTLLYSVFDQSQLKLTKKSWIQIKTVLPRGVEVQKYAIQLTDENELVVKVAAIDDSVYSVKFALYKPILQWQSVPLSATVIKVPFYQ